jgi:hypothetical protein
VSFCGLHEKDTSPSPSKGFGVVLARVVLHNRRSDAPNRWGRNVPEKES